MPSRPLVLASSSPARLALLCAAGIEPVVMVSGVDESGLDLPDTRALVQELAVRKAQAVAARALSTGGRPAGDRSAGDRAEGNLPAGALVLGCDSLLDLDGEALGKPASGEQALRRWQRMRGRRGTLLTGHCLVDTSSGQQVADVAATIVRFGSPTDAELAAYVASGEPLSVAGGFTLDGRSAPYVDGIDGDHGNVIGLSLPLLRVLLGRLGIAIHDLWAESARSSDPAQGSEPAPVRQTRPC